MRRAPIVLTTTVAGTAGLLMFKPHEPALSFASTASAVADTATATTPAAADSSTSSSSTSSSTSSAAATTPAASTGTKSATGEAIQTQYGPTQVRVTVSAGKITKVAVLSLTGNDPKSVQISAQAEPTLLQSVLTNQTAAIDSVSGATITSASYAASLQSALDKVDFKAADGARASSTIPTVEEHGGPDGGFR